MQMDAVVVDHRVANVDKARQGIHLDNVLPLHSSGTHSRNEWCVETVMPMVVRMMTYGPCSKVAATFRNTV
jgi:hypothetical protein